MLHSRAMLTDDAAMDIHAWIEQAAQHATGMLGSLIVTLLGVSPTHVEHHSGAQCMSEPLQSRTRPSTKLPTVNCHRKQGNQ